MRHFLAALRQLLSAARCPTGCYCVRDRFVFRCTVCGHIC